MSCHHEWVVFSTALQQRGLMLECAGCHAGGLVKDPSDEEWAEACHAPGHPYRWEFNERVRLIPDTPGPNTYVRRAPGGYAPSEHWCRMQDWTRRSDEPDCPA
jgi:hypothetical protein